MGTSGAKYLPQSEAAKEEVHRHEIEEEIRGDGPGSTVAKLQEIKEAVLEMVANHNRELAEAVSNAIAKEREACAKAIEDHFDSCRFVCPNCTELVWVPEERRLARRYAEAIRDRGKSPVEVKQIIVIDHSGGKTRTTTYDKKPWTSPPIYQETSSVVGDWLSPLQIAEALAAEREACAREADRLIGTLTLDNERHDGARVALTRLAKNIRDRGNP